MEQAERSDNDKLPVGWKICPERSPPENTVLVWGNHSVSVSLLKVYENTVLISYLGSVVPLLCHVVIIHCYGKSYSFFPLKAYLEIKINTEVFQLLSPRPLFGKFTIKYYKN